MELAELDYDFQLHEDQRAADSKLFVRFFIDILPDTDATEKTGIRKFRDVEMVTIMVPGDKRNVVTREVREEDKNRFPKVYEHFKKGLSDVPDGFPLSQWPMATRSLVEELKYMGFHTVESVANAAEQVMGKYPGLRELQRRAKAWLQAQEGAAPIEKMQAELEKRDLEIKALQAQMQELMKAKAK
jgi:hypothetical protein